MNFALLTGGGLNTGDRHGTVMAEFICGCHARHDPNRVARVVPRRHRPPAYLREEKREYSFTFKGLLPTKANGSEKEVNS